MRLANITTPAGFFTIAPFDHRGSLAKLLGIDLATDEGVKTITQFKIWCMEVFSPICSGALVDPVYGFPAIEKKAESCGLILTLENTSYGESQDQVPQLLPNWGVEHVKHNYAVAKLLCHFHPSEPQALAKKQFVTQLATQAHQLGIDFLLEPIIYNPTPQASGQATKAELTVEEFDQAQLETARFFQQYVDVLKLQYPGDALTCAKITAELDVPWILLSRGLPYDQFKQALQVSLENGCKGFAVGRAIWQEVGTFKTADKKPDMVAIENFLRTKAKDRMAELIGMIPKT